MAWNTIVHGCEWSDDSGAEIAKGWIGRAGSIAELAGIIGRDPAALRATVDRYYASGASGVDGEFGHHADTLQAIAKPLFHAIEVVAAILCTVGGVRRNIESEVLDQAGRPTAALRGGRARVDVRGSLPGWLLFDGGDDRRARRPAQRHRAVPLVRGVRP